jgi:uncharacterized protein with HEPN domain
MSDKGQEVVDYLEDILNAIIEVDDFLQGMSYEDFAAAHLVILIRTEV